MYKRQELEIDAEALQVKLVVHVHSVANGELEEIGKFVIDIGDIFLLSLIHI